MAEFTVLHSARNELQQKKKGSMRNIRISRETTSELGGPSGIPLRSCDNLPPDSLAIKSPFRARTSSYIQAAPIKLDETEHYSRMEFRNSLLKPVGSLNSLSDPLSHELSFLGSISRHQHVDARLLQSPWQLLLLLQQQQSRGLEAAQKLMRHALASQLLLRLLHGALGGKRSLQHSPGTGRSGWQPDAASATP
ncbi:MAG: hypothetical protein FRX49_11814 [Trebouxia sp. A1-2]|nr:MAG: hypothetical protein FRX49_11814 [Trebouxia sp. A1-2]